MVDKECQIKGKRQKRPKMVKYEKSVFFDLLT